MNYLQSAAGPVAPIAEEEACAFRQRKNFNRWRNMAHSSERGISRV